jgi:hypothetical protein
MKMVVSSGAVASGRSHGAVYMACDAAMSRTTLYSALGVDELPYPL